MAVISDAYIQWIDYSQLTDVQEVALSHGCTYTAHWLDIEPSIKVTLKKIVGKQKSQSFDFYQVNYFTYKQCNATRIIIFLRDF